MAMVANGRGALALALLAGAASARGDERDGERARMVRTQIAAPDDRRDPVRDRAVLAAMLAVPRHLFVPPSVSARAYDDTPLPIGWGQTISQPYVVALMTELLALRPESKVLEIGTGSGYQAAVLAQLCRHVYTIEILQPLATRAAALLRAQAPAVQTREGDGYFGWPEAAPFDAIIVTAAAGHLPPPLWDQLKPGGRIVLPIGGPYELQRLVVVEKTADGQRRSRTVIDVRFVPLTGPAAGGP
jgi:protein-L-isoaspartate(D-aspartate) O-methyltransferase